MPKKEKCGFCLSCKKDRSRNRYYCQFKLQKFWQSGKKEGKDDIKEILVRFNDPACELFSDTRY